MRWIGCVHCEKFRRDFVARTFALVRTCFAPSFVKQPNGPGCTQMIRNAPKRQIMVQLSGLGAFVVKNSEGFRGTKFCTCSARFPPSFVRQQNGPECTEILRNTPKRRFRVQWVGSDVFVAKNSDATSWHELLH